ncbi:MULTISPECIES: SIR2 family protein [unclassified Agrobacterium]|uniref:SIR2 family protein n=2 Tax=Agrobacterium TaxID=357 RepID=UPI002446C416|nr:MULTISPECIES: SIR2 family protein [unclassified Agrobacterium]MDH0611938.1 SIR2 family protein [Agrobacterium sp. GD03872]MDH0695835.1 SIR2 family protein [Agrobacterium sp. GD03871]MDH1058891.1 SIR2 family protein [Agrobacterium sp. GD03992]MDH2210982.1 SIR2 family protein [Agrobacterium sp. GD03643]MDH2217601.1 SIR2 family protein [Agrobacterium sp. GD03638]
MRKLFIFGNGLGMALAPDVYNLNSVMTSAWDNKYLTETQKKLILACLPDDVSKPTSEEQLAKLQEIVGACEVLLGIRPVAFGHWLSPHGQEFPNAVHQFAFEVAKQMFLAKHKQGSQVGEPCRLPTDFVKSLIKKVEETQSHVATLNYDGLLSSAFEMAGVLGDGKVLRDGFIDQKFDTRNLFRHREEGGWYLHLHGCPLFVDREKSKPSKLAASSLTRNLGQLKHVGRHIVLTHVTHKRTIIAGSEILSTYWEFLKRALDESQEIVIFGYSGNDTHLNQLIAQKRADKLVRVVEWLGAGYEDLRGPFWAAQLGGPVNLTLKEDVLTFADW